MSDREEIERRYADLREGWSDTARAAVDELRPTEFMSLGLSDPIRIQALGLSVADAARQGELEFKLRPHWVQKITAPEVPLRDAFDEALMHLQIIELAVETGYLPLDVVYDDVRHMMCTLLWSKGALTFISSYDYVGVRYLAERVRVDFGLPRVEPPPVNEFAQIRFATFLSHYDAWSHCPEITAWCRFLDDYRRYEDETAKFRRYLAASEELEGPIAAHFEWLLGGMFRFVVALVGLFGVLAEKEAPYFGLVHAYWLSRFHGMRLGSERRYFPRGTDWSDIAAESPRFHRFFSDEPAEALVNAKEQLAEVARAWRSVQTLIESTIGRPIIAEQSVARAVDAIEST